MSVQRVKQDSPQWTGLIVVALALNGDRGIIKGDAHTAADVLDMDQPAMVARVAHGQPVASTGT